MRLKIALAKEVIGRKWNSIYEKHDRITPTLIPSIFNLVTPRFQMRGLRNSISGRDLGEEP